MTDASAWARSGAMALTGHLERRPLAPKRLVEAISIGLTVDELALVGERAAFIDGRRQGRTSVGGPCRLLKAEDGWIALNLARDDDLDLLAAWLDSDRGLDVIAERAVHELHERATLLGLPAARLGAVEAPSQPYVATTIGEARLPKDETVIVDLSSLWAGPLAANLLHATIPGARVVKVESTRRPDGARQGPKPFFDLLHGGHDAVAIDLTTTDGVRALRRLLERADVVVEAARPRVMRNWGIDPADVARGRPGLVWLSITAYGRDGEAANRVGFGDDAAVAGGLVARDHEGLPVFVADAVADPLTGIFAAKAVAESRLRGGGELIDVALAKVAAFVSRRLGDEWEESDEPPAAPKARVPTRRAPRIGEHNTMWLT
ncbi:MAG: CoA transferase [Acidimicrobiia bacterium]